jgi:hypothetical protein
MIEEDLHLIQGYMHAAGTRAVADLIRSRSSEVEVYQTPRQLEIQSSPSGYPPSRIQHRSSPPWTLIAIGMLWAVSVIGLLVWVMRWLASATVTTVAGHSGTVVFLVGLALLAGMVWMSRGKNSKAVCSGAHCDGCDH